MTSALPYMYGTLTDQKLGPAGRVTAGAYATNGGNAVGYTFRCSRVCRPSLHSLGTEVCVA